MGKRPDRLRRNGIWDAGGLDEPRDSLEFWMMCAIADGILEREWDRSKSEWMYRNTRQGNQQVVAMLRNGR